MPDEDADVGMPPFIPSTPSTGTSSAATVFATLDRAVAGRPSRALQSRGDPGMTPIDPIAEWIEPNVQIENMVSGRGKARSTARTSVAGIAYAMTRYLDQALAVAEQG